MTGVHSTLQVLSDLFNLHNKTLRKAILSKITDEETSKEKVTLRPRFKVRKTYISNFS